MLNTELLTPTDQGLDRAAELLRAGQLVSFPSETVYGLGGDARQDHAVASIFAAKGRPHFNPLIAHVADRAMAETIAVFDARARRIADQFWPGPLTLVLPLRPDAGLAPLATSGLDSVAIRMPAHGVTRALLERFGGPMAGPSANPSGRISPTRADHVMAGLGGKIAAVLDGGACEVGVESTILGLVGTPQLLRPGGLAVEVLEEALGLTLEIGGSAEKPNAPGQLTSHYAPGALVRLNATEAGDDEVLVGFGPIKGALTLSESGDVVEAAARLFQTLREADALAGNSRSIAFAPIPDTGLGRAINDRLTRAAAPRG